MDSFVVAKQKPEFDWQFTVNKLEAIYKELELDKPRLKMILITHLVNDMYEVLYEGANYLICNVVSWKIIERDIRKIDHEKDLWNPFGFNESIFLMFGIPVVEDDELVKKILAKAFNLAMTYSKKKTAHETVAGLIEAWSKR